jgi:hypothetical protein
MPAINVQYVSFNWTGGGHTRQPRSTTTMGGFTLIPGAPSGPLPITPATGDGLTVNSPTSANLKSPGFTYAFAFMSVSDGVSINLFSASFNPNPALQFTVGSGPVTILYVYLATSTATGGGGSGDSGAVIDAFNQSIGALVDNDFVTVSPDNAAHSITDEANVDGWVDTEDSGYTIIADSPNIGPYQSLPTNAVFVNWVVIVGGIPPGVVITNANLVVPEGVTVYALAIYYNPPKPSKEVYPDKTQHVLEKLPMQDLKNEMLDKVAQDNSKSQTLHEKTTDKIYVGEFGGKMGDGNPNMPEAIAVHLSSLSQKISDLESRLSTALKGKAFIKAADRPAVGKELARKSAKPK